MITVRDLTAPGYEPTAADLPWYRRALRQGGGYTLPSVLFLAIPVVSTWGHVPALGMALLLGQCAVIAGLYLGTSLIMHWPHGARWAWLFALMLAVLSLAWSSGDPATPAYYTAFVCVAAAMLLPWREVARAIVLSAMGGVVLAGLGHDPFAALMAFAGGLTGFSVGLGIDSARNREALKLEERRTATLAVAAERERIGRDLHDILGHSLTTIAVKADLARRLVDRDPARAASEIDDLARVARQALADVRATASGMREVRLASEIAAARSVLGAAGVRCQAPSAVEPTDDAASELLGYAVREAVTNVVRHAGATTCTITADARSVSVTDDGRGFAGEQKGSGLVGLRGRFEEAGGTLAVESGASGTRVVATLPGGAA